jgi:hypothetical protein
MWLYQTDEGNVSANNGAGTSDSANPYINSKAFADQMTELKNSFEKFVLSKNFDDIVKNAQQSMISMDNSAKSLVRSMGGFIDLTSDAGKTAGNFRGQLESAFFAVQDIGGSFKDVTDNVASLASNMGRIVAPTENVMINMVAFTKSTGLASADVGSMVTNLIRFGGTQQESLDTMHEIANEARMVGLNTSKYMKDVNTNLKLADGFGFKNGVTGVREMVKQASLLRTEIDKIGASSLQNKVLTPEGAIEAAAGFQMLGGSVGALADPFQLLNMAQNDLAGLQKELVNSTKSAYVFNSETGEFKASTEDLYRLRQQAELVGGNFDEMARAGREAAKLDFIGSRINLAGFTDEQKGLIASLAQIDKGGIIKVDLPGFESGGQTLEKLANNANFKSALDEYTKKQEKTEKEIALSQMTISENQAKDVSIIKHSVLAQMGFESRKELINEIKNANKSLGETFKTASETVSKTSGSLVKGVTKAETKLAKSSQKTVGETAEAEREIQDYLNRIQNDPSQIRDAFIPNSGKSPIISTEGQLFKGLPNDKVAVGTELDTFLNQSMSLMDTLNSKPNLNKYINDSSNRLANLNNGTSPTKDINEVNGKIDVNINLNGTINGDRNGNIEEIFKDSRIQNQIMETVLTKLESYKKQQGVLTIS